MPDRRAVAGAGRVGSAAEILRTHRDVRAKEISLFCDAVESSLLASILTDGGAKESFEEFAAALAGKIPE